MSLRERLGTDPALALSPELRLDALAAWLMRVEVPALLIPLLEGVVLGHHGAALARYVDVPLEDLPDWERYFARCASRTVYEAAAEVLEAAIAASRR